MKLFGQYSLVLLIITLCCSSCFKGPDKSASELKLDAEKKAEAEKIAALARRYEAIIDWKTNLPPRGLLGPVFTYDLSKALNLPDGRPIVFAMQLTDVIEHRGKFQAKFLQSYFTDYFFDICLNLNCSSNQAAELLKVSGGDLPSRFALVVKVENVSKPTFTVRGKEAGETDEIEIKADENYFIIEATCVDMLRLRNGFSSESN